MIDKFVGKHRFLSNFYPSEIAWCGITFKTVEHAYQAAKAMDMDFETRQAIANLVTPGQAKRASRNIVLRGDWHLIKVPRMRMFLGKKFSIPTLKKLLLETGDEMLMERNNWGDTFWGACDGLGVNMLGCLLMELREAMEK